MRKEVIFDSRWLGNHGIGRFANEIMKRTCFKSFSSKEKLLSFKDVLTTPYQLKMARPDHYFTPGFNAVLGNPCQYSLTIHDLIHLHTEEQSSAKYIYYNFLLKSSVKHAKYIFTVSKYSKKMICEWANVKEEKVIVLGNGVGSSFKCEGNKKQNIRPFLLYVGNQKPHKNVPSLIKAFASSTLPDDFDLFLSGTNSRETAEEIHKSKVNGKVFSLGDIPEEDLPSYYRGAHAVVMPSLYEGFGLPVIEAMACGTPVLSSNRTSLPEIGGDAAIYFDAGDHDSFVNGLESLRNSRLMEEHRKKGIANSMRFDWDNVVDTLCKHVVYS